ncbi:MAG: hypothetical protein R3Y44_01700 [Rikenellaceae bacterium]
MRSISILLLSIVALCSCNNYRHTSIFETIPESELLSKARKDTLFLSHYQSINESRKSINSLTLEQKSKFYNLTYNDFCRLSTTINNPKQYDKYKTDWDELYHADELACDSLLSHYNKMCDWNSLSANEALYWHAYFIKHNMISDYGFIDYNELLKNTLVPQIIRDYWLFPFNKGSIIKELINPNYLDYNDYYIKQEFPLIYDFFVTMEEVNEK